MAALVRGGARGSSGALSTAQPRFIQAGWRRPGEGFAANLETNMYPARQNTTAQTGKTVGARPSSAGGQASLESPAAAILPSGVFKKVSRQGRGPLVSVKHRSTDKTRGRGRPRPILELTLRSHQARALFAFLCLARSVIAARKVCGGVLEVALFSKHPYFIGD